MHAAVDFGQYDYANLCDKAFPVCSYWNEKILGKWGFVPNSPASIRRKFDFEKLATGTYTEREFMASMPVATEMTKVMTVVRGLVVHSVEQQYLGFAKNSAPGSAFADDWFTDPNAKRVYDDFAARIFAVQKRLLELNERRLFRTTT